MPREIWKLIFDGWYEVSSLGRVRRAKPGKATQVGRLCKYHLDSDGYLYVGLSVNSKVFRIEIHILVANAFLGPRPRGKQVNHKNLVKTDNRESNLEYKTPAGNVKHAWENGACKPSEWKSAARKKVSRTMKKLRAQQRRDGTLRTMCTSKRYR